MQDGRHHIFTGQPTNRGCPSPYRTQRGGDGRDPLEHPDLKLVMTAASARKIFDCGHKKIGIIPKSAESNITRSAE